MSHVIRTHYYYYYYYYYYYQITSNIVKLSDRILDQGEDNINLDITICKPILMFIDTPFPHFCGTCYLLQLYVHRLSTWQRWSASGSCSRRPTARDGSQHALTLQFLTAPHLLFFVCLVCTWTTRTLMSASRTAVNAYIGSHLSSIKY